MAAARMERTTVDVASADAQIQMRATGQVMLFRVNQAFDSGVDEASVSVGTSLRPPLPA